MTRGVTESASEAVQEVSSETGEGARGKVPGTERAHNLVSGVLASAQRPASMTTAFSQQDPALQPLAWSPGFSLSV